MRKYCCFGQQVLVNLNRLISWFGRLVFVRPYCKKPSPGTARSGCRRWVRAEARDSWRWERGEARWQPEMGASWRAAAAVNGRWGGVRRLPEMEMSGVRWRPEIEMERRTPAAGDRGRVDECDLEIEA
jgi:hypothetical protein